MSLNVFTDLDLRQREVDIINAFALSKIKYLNKLLENRNSECGYEELAVIDGELSVWNEIIGGV